jgi:hypothetical protein
VAQADKTALEEQVAEQKRRLAAATAAAAALAADKKAAEAQVAELKVLLAESTALSDTWQGQQAKAGEELNAMASEVRATDRPRVAPGARRKPGGPAR